MDLLIWRTRTAAVLALLVTLGGLMMNVFIRNYLDESAFESAIIVEGCRLAIFINIGLTSAIVAFLGAATFLDSLVRRHLVTFEWATMFLSLLGMWSGVLASPFYLTGFRGYDAKAMPDFGGQSDAVLLMMLLGIVTILHVGIPLRWFVVFPLEVVAVASYALVVFSRTSGEDLTTGTYCLGCLAAILVAGALSKRAAEVGERAAWKDLVNERSLRCSAEFELSAQKTAKQSKPQDARSEGKPESVPESVPYTTDTGRVFQSMYEAGASASETLQQIARIGDAEHWRVRHNELNILEGEVLGTGGFGVVTKGIFCGMLVAVKRTLQKLDEAALQNIPQLCNELRVLRHLRHPNIVACHGAVVNPAGQEIALVLEAIAGVTLTQYMSNREQLKRISLLPRVQVMVGVCRALVYMHTRRPHLIHGDLKSGNIMVQGSGESVHAKLLDFGLSRVLSRSARRLGGTLAWVAPEVVRGTAPKCSADVYSFGRVVSYVATGQSLNDQVSPSSLRRALQQGRPPLPRWPGDCVFEPSCRPLVQSCLLAEEARRPSIMGVYGKLLDLPQEMHLVDVNGDFVGQVSFIARHWLWHPQDAAATMAPMSSGESAGDATSFVEASLPGPFSQGPSQTLSEEVYVEESLPILSEEVYVEDSTESHGAEANGPRSEKSRPVRL